MNLLSALVEKKSHVEISIDRKFPHDQKNFIGKINYAFDFKSRQKTTEKKENLIP